jgi:ATP-dependent phosphofructokinase / diphosphate-dependent phosphofructokinase
MAKRFRKIAVMTGGGDCPGLNAVIRAVTKTAINKYNMEVWGVEDGYQGLIEDRIHPLSYGDVSNILTLGGTILGSSNTSNPFAYPVTKNGRTRNTDVSDLCIENLTRRGIEALVAIGGDGTMASAAEFAQKGFPVMGVPKTIDNDIWGTDLTFGFNTAVNTATEAIDKVHTTASSHHRVMVVEVMGRYAGWIALHAGAAGGADVICIPEIPYDHSEDCRVHDRPQQDGASGFRSSPSPRAPSPKGGSMVIYKQVKNSPDPLRLGGISGVLADQLERITGQSCRAVNLGHVQRGGSPTPFDRVLGTNFGFHALELLAAGQVNRLVVWKDGKFGDIPLSKTAGKIKTVKPNDPLVRAAKAVGTSFGV